MEAGGVGGVGGRKASKKGKKGGKKGNKPKVSGRPVSSRPAGDGTATIAAPAPPAVTLAPVAPAKAAAPVGSCYRLVAGEVPLKNQS